MSTEFERERERERVRVVNKVPQLCLILDEWFAHIKLYHYITELLLLHAAELSSKVSDEHVKSN